MTNNNPLWKIRIGGIEAATWNNALKSPSGETVDRVAVTIDRWYKDKGGDWKSSSPLSLSDLMKAQVVIRHAIDRMVQDKRGGVSRFLFRVAAYKDVSEVEHLWSQSSMRSTDRFWINTTIQQAVLSAALLGDDSCAWWNEPGGGCVYFF